MTDRYAARACAHVRQPGIPYCPVPDCGEGWAGPLPLRVVLPRPVRSATYSDTMETQVVDTVCAELAAAETDVGWLWVLRTQTYTAGIVSVEP